MVMNVVEKPLLQEIMARANNNQSLASQWLGINRNTLRKKLLQHQLLS
jgi:Fis family transcriptional regulator, factor for inversion stimulation protein